MYYIKKLLKKICYQFVGQSSIKFFDGKNEYFIGSNNYVKNANSKDGYAVTLFEQEVLLQNQLDDIDNNIKKQILYSLKKMLEDDKIIVTIDK